MRQSNTSSSAATNRSRSQQPNRGGAAAAAAATTSGGRGGPNGGGSSRVRAIVLAIVGAVCVLLVVHVLYLHGLADAHHQKHHSNGAAVRGDGEKGGRGGHHQNALDQLRLLDGQGPAADNEDESSGIRTTDKAAEKKHARGDDEKTPSAAAAAGDDAPPATLGKKGPTRQRKNTAAAPTDDEMVLGGGRRRNDNQQPIADNNNNADDGHDGNGNNPFTFHLDMNEPPRNKPTCPIPELHPAKYSDKYGWGIRSPPHPDGRTCADRQHKRYRQKKNNSNKNKKNSDKREYENDADENAKFSALSEHGGHADIIFLTKRCKKSGVVWEFEEMKDSDFSRMTSTMDAEDRQNLLKERFSLENIMAPPPPPAGGGRDRGGDNNEDDYSFENAFHPPFIKKVSHPNPSTGTIERIESPYIIARCGGESELYIRAPRPDDAATERKRRRRREAREKRRRKNNDVIYEGGYVEDHTTEDLSHNRHYLDDGSGAKHADAIKDTLAAHGLKNVLHIMFDSTSLYAQRRASQKITNFLERLNNKPYSPSYVFPFFHYHAVSCCSPGNQIPMYSGTMNGEGDPFINAEPTQNSKDWVWNIAAENGFRTFWGIDNCPDKSARDFHAFPSVDSRVVAPVCLAGPLLSHKSLGCVADKSVDEIVIEGLESFWAHHEDERKFGMAHFISPHESSEKLLIELDELIANYFEHLEYSGVLKETAIILWSDHGINFGPYASTSDGEIEKLFPFANVILPREFAEKSGMMPQLRNNMHQLTTPYDLYELTRRLLYYPARPPKFAHDPTNPRLPTPQESHIMASFQKPITPLDVSRVNISDERDCLSANIPVEFCTCIPWRDLPIDGGDDGENNNKKKKQNNAAEGDDGSSASADLIIAHIGGNARDYARRALAEHNALLEPYKAVCHYAMALRAVKTFEVQPWPVDYQPKERNTAKRMWAKPNRDMVRITYETTAMGFDDEKGDSASASSSSPIGTFIAVFSVSQKNSTDIELARIDRLDAMGERRCGVVDKLTEHMCICK